MPDGRLWICEFCLKYMKSKFGASRHRVCPFHMQVHWLGADLGLVGSSNAKLGIRRAMRSTGTAISPYLRWTGERIRCAHSFIAIRVLTILIGA